MNKPYSVFAVHPPCLNQCLGHYISFNEAQGAAAIYRRIYGGQIAIRIVWDQQP